MTKLDDLKASILYYKKRDGSWPKEFGYEVKFSTLETLIQIAEAAFEISSLPNVGRIITTDPLAEFMHDDNFIAKIVRIEELKKELESGD